MLSKPKRSERRTLSIASDQTANGCPVCFHCREYALHSQCRCIIRVLAFLEKGRFVKMSYGKKRGPKKSKARKGGRTGKAAAVKKGAHRHLPIIKNPTIKKK